MGEDRFPRGWAPELLQSGEEARDAIPGAGGGRSEPACTFTNEKLYCPCAAATRGGRIPSRAVQRGRISIGESEPMIPGAVVKAVAPESVGARAGVRPGDIIMKIGRKPVLDVLDYMYLTAAPRFRVEVLREQRPMTIEVRKDDEGEPMGLELEDELVDGIRNCRAKCDFCFLDQMPRGYRKTLYVKDDDYRLSFLHGNFVTLTNLDQDDWNKIRQMHLSPMHISVHATNPEVRRRILKNPQSESILEDLERLRRWGIQMHTQIVVQPGLNDGAELERSIREVRSFHPHVETLAVVPVGLTKWRDRCTPISAVSIELAREIIRQVQAWQRKFEAEIGSPFVYLSDEFYHIADHPLPPHSHYGAYEQLENGVGLSRLLITEFNRRVRWLPGRMEPRRVLVVTGASGGKVLPQMVERMNQIENLRVDLTVVKNDFLGHSVTVAGLLGGRDMLSAMQKAGPHYDAALLPSVSLREGDGVFLDDLRLEEMRGALPFPVVPTDARGADFIASVLGSPLQSRRMVA